MSNGDHYPKDSLGLVSTIATTNGVTPPPLPTSKIQAVNGHSVSVVMVQGQCSVKQWSVRVFGSQERVRNQAVGVQTGGNQAVGQ